ncbi:MAG: hypothetical protein ACUVWQ_10985 [Candidatus Aminicenantales bacterium]
MARTQERLDFQDRLLGVLHRDLIVAPLVKMGEKSLSEPPCGQRQTVGIPALLADGAPQGLSRSHLRGVLPPA